MWVIMTHLSTEVVKKVTYRGIIRAEKNRLFCWSQVSPLWIWLQRQLCRGSLYSYKKSDCHLEVTNGCRSTDVQPPVAMWSICFMFDSMIYLAIDCWPQYFAMELHEFIPVRNL